MKKMRILSLAAGLGLILSPVAHAPAQAAEGPTQTNSNGPVTVALTPVTVTPGEPLAVKIVLDTHSVDLTAVALDRAVTVQTPAGLVAPAKIESAKGDTHHRQAVLVFPAGTVTRGLSTLDVLVKDVGGVPERRFRWSLPLTTSEAAPPARPGAPAQPGMGSTPGGGMMGGGMMMSGGHEMMTMMQQMGAMLQQMGMRMAAGQMSPEQSKAMGDLMQQMGGMMAGMGGMGGGAGAQPDMSKMMERMGEMQKRMNEMQQGMSAPRPSPR